MSETWVRAGRAAVIFVALVTAAISFTHIRDLALAHGGDSLSASLLPLGIDGAVAAMTVFMHQASGLALWLARCVLVAAVGMTVACNTAYGAAFGVTGALLWSSPAVLFVGCVEVSVLMVRKTRPAEDTKRDKTVDTLTSTESKIPRPEPQLNGQSAGHNGGQRKTAKLTVLADPELFTLSAKDLAARRGVSQSTIQRDRRKAKLAMANGNGTH